MKEEWKTLDKHGKICTKLNKVETVPIQVEYSLVADYLRPNNGICKKVFVILKILVLLFLLVLFTWMAITLSANYYLKLAHILEKNKELETFGEKQFDKWLHSLNVKSLFDFNNPRLINDFQKFLDNPEELDDDPKVVLIKVMYKYRRVSTPFIMNLLYPVYQEEKESEIEDDYDSTDSIQSTLKYVDLQEDVSKDNDYTTISASTERSIESNSFDSI